MESNSNINNTAQVQHGEISLTELLPKIREWYRYLFSKWKIVLLAGILGAASGFTYAYLKKPVYTAICTFVLEESKSGGSLSQYAGLAAMAGINIGVSSSGLFEGDNIIELYKSRSMLQKTLLSYGTFHGKKDLLINQYLYINNLRDRWRKDRKLKDLSFDISRGLYTRVHDSVLADVVDDINKKYLNVDKPDKRLNIIKVEVKSTNEDFSRNFVDNVVFNVNAFYVETRTKKALGNLRSLQHQADSIRKILNYNLSSAALSIDANPNANSALQILRVPSQRKQVDIQANTAMYAEVVKNLELAKLSFRQETPLIQIIDRPILPLRKASVGKASGITIGLVLSVLAVSFLLLISNGRTASSSRRDP